MHDHEERLIRRYAAGDLAWSSLRDQHGFKTYLDVLAALGELGLRPPVAPMAEPNLQLRQRGRAVLRRQFAGPERP